MLSGSSNSIDLFSIVSDLSYCVDVRLKQFTAKNTKLGFSRLLPHTEFNDPSKGYLNHKNICKFGVEVFVINKNIKGGRFFTIDKPHKNHFSWKIQKLTDARCYSHDFIIEGFKWYVVSYSSTSLSV